MKKIVISLGGSLIVPDKVDYNFLKKLKNSLNRLKRNYKIVIVTGGGKTARNYIEPLRKEGLSNDVQCLLGIKATKLNAMLLSNFLKVNKLLPDSLKEVKNLLKRYNIVVCGSLGFKPNMTSDGDSADIARYIKADLFINMTNVAGLYNKDPNKYKNAKFVPEISFARFLAIANRIKFEAGQHFVLDKTAAVIIARHKIRTVILSGIKNLENCIKGKKFRGTTIS